MSSATTKRGGEVNIDRPVLLHEEAAFFLNVPISWLHQNAGRVKIPRFRPPGTRISRLI